MVDCTLRLPEQSHQRPVLGRYNLSAHQDSAHSSHAKSCKRLWLGRWSAMWSGRCAETPNGGSPWSRRICSLLSRSCRLRLLRLRLRRGLRLRLQPRLLRLRLRLRLRRQRQGELPYLERSCARGEVCVCSPKCENSDSIWGDRSSERQISEK